MGLISYKRIHFGDWLITVSCCENCLFRVIAYNINIGSTIVIDKIFVNETDAFNIMIEQLKSMMIGTEVNK